MDKATKATTAGKQQQKRKTSSLSFLPEGGFAWPIARDLQHEPATALIENATGSASVRPELCAAHRGGTIKRTRKELNGSSSDRSKEGSEPPIARDLQRVRTNDTAASLNKRSSRSAPTSHPRGSEPPDLGNTRRGGSEGTIKRSTKESKGSSSDGAEKGPGPPIAKDLQRVRNNDPAVASATKVSRSPSARHSRGSELPASDKVRHGASEGTNKRTSKASDASGPDRYRRAESKSRRDQLRWEENNKRLSDSAFIKAEGAEQPVRDQPKHGTEDKDPTHPPSNFQKSDGDQRSRSRTSLRNPGPPHEHTPSPAGAYSKIIARWDQAISPSFGPAQRALTLRRWIETHDFSAPITEEALFLDHLSFQPNDLVFAMSHVSDTAQALMYENGELQKKFKRLERHPNRFLDTYADVQAGETDSARVIPVDEMPGRLQRYVPAELHLDPGFKNTVVVLAKIARRIKRESQQLEKDIESLDPLIKLGGAVADHIPQYVANTHTQRSCLYALERAYDHTISYWDLEKFIRQERLWKELKDLIKRPEDLVFEAKPPMIDLWKMSNEEIAEIDVGNGKTEARKEVRRTFAKSLALLCKSAHNIEEETVILRTAIEKFKPFKQPVQSGRRRSKDDLGGGWPRPEH